MKKLLPFVFLLLNAGCSTVQYQIGFPSDADQSSFTRYEVKEIQIVTSKISDAAFGPWSVSLTRTPMNKSTKKNDGFITDEEKNSASEKYSYKLSGPDRSIWSGECESSAEYYCKESGIIFSSVVDGYYKNYLRCRFTSPGQQPIEMQIEVNENYKDQSIPGFKKGYIRSGNIQLDLERTMSTEKFSLMPMHIGYYIYYNNELVAVVQNMIHGNVYISSTLDRKLLPLVVNASAALLTYYDLEVEVLAMDEDEED